MAQKYLIITFFIELASFYFIIYLLTKSIRWVNDKQNLVDEISSEIPELIRDYKNDLQKFNDNIKQKQVMRDSLLNNLGINLIKDIIIEVIKLKFTVIPFGKKSGILIILRQFWEYKHYFRNIISSLIVK